MILYHTKVHSLFRAVIAALFSTPARRIGFAIVFSVLIHAFVLWLPYIHLSHGKVRFPPLTVRLEILPKHEAIPEPVAQPDLQPELVAQAIKPGGKSSGKTATNIPVKMKKMEKSAATHQFPKNVQLTFDVYKGAGIFRIGEIRQQLDIHKDKYTLRSSKQANGLSSLLNTDRITQISQGKIGDQGLQPEIFKVEKITSGGKQNLKVTFDWATQKLRFLQGGETILPADAQDGLSFMYQLSQISMQQEIIPLSISDGANLEKYEIEIGRAEDIDSPMGKLRALHLRKIHSQDEAYFEIWLGLEYRLLPVKFRQIDGAGQVIEEFVISDMRASDE